MKEKQNYISFARVISAFAVVMIHINGNCFYEFNVDGCWSISNILSSVLSFAVPVFLMITGVTLIDYSDRYSTKEYFKRRVNKIVVPFIFWGCLIATLYRYYTGKMEAHLLYNFLVWQIGIYLIIPLFSYIQKEHREKIIFYIVIVSFVINFLLPFIDKVFHIGYFYKIPFEVAQCYVMYPLVGYLIGKKEITKNVRWIIYIIAGIALSVMIGGTHMYSVTSGKIDDRFLGYPNMTCLLYSIGVFVFIKEIGSCISNEKILSMIEQMSGYTFSVYLIHWYIIDFIFTPYISNTHTMLYKFVAPVIVYIISLGLIWIARKIPLIRKVFP